MAPECRTSGGGAASDRICTRSAAVLYWASMFAEGAKVVPLLCPSLSFEAVTHLPQGCNALSARRIRATPGTRKLDVSLRWLAGFEDILLFSPTRGKRDLRSLAAKLPYTVTLGTSYNWSEHTRL